MTSIKRIALTAGEPAGIGPDLCLQIAQQKQSAQLIAIVDPDLLEQRAKQLNLPIELSKADLTEPAKVAGVGQLYYLPISLASSVTAGRLNSSNSSYVIETLQLALDGCMDGRFDAIVTAPVHKGVINDAGVDFSGHTEFFADGAGVEKVVMMLATEQLRVALATTHLPLRAVADAISKDSLRQVLTITVNSLKQQFGLKNPRIAVCGLNPHAGEGGHLGREEIDVIQPVIDEMQSTEATITGAWPADTIFNQDKLQHYDAVLAMFHDQGLPVLKHHGFGKAVNITLGLPFIRTSVDHGTALDLAGKGTAQATSLQTAIDMALMMANSRDTE
ncbi:4-hydroxythreonine-4-phosphate dehydrogenase PdxA [Methylophaga sp.]|uniref:4-hydroxythreonine-4-phosphate dehydrogenase PdxA n=1 Tax=Methylophaga sp. TaxID=2024840 RepID=UPI003F6A2A1C